MFGGSLGGAARTLLGGEAFTEGLLVWESGQCTFLVTSLS